jgi:hypothetical protein
MNDIEREAFRKAKDVVVAEVPEDQQFTTHDPMEDRHVQRFLHNFEVSTYRLICLDGGSICIREPN